MRKLKLRSKLTGWFFFIVKRSSTSYRVGRKFSSARMRGFVSNIYDLYRGAESNHVSLKVTGHKSEVNCKICTRQGNRITINTMVLLLRYQLKKHNDWKNINMIKAHAKSNQWCKVSRKTLINNKVRILN